MDQDKQELAYKAYVQYIEICSDQEIIKLYKEMLVAKNSKRYTKGDENNISKKELHYLRDFFKYRK